MANSVEFYYLGELEEMSKDELLEVLGKYGVKTSSTKKSDIIREILEEQTDVAIDIAVELENLEEAQDTEPVIRTDDNDNDYNNVQEETNPVTNVNASVSATLNANTQEIEVGIAVSCGAASGNFPVVGRTVGQVVSFLAEALNIESSSYPVVNGSAVSNDYVLKPGDVLEFVKTAGNKGSERSRVFYF